MAHDCIVEDVICKVMSRNQVRMYRNKRDFARPIAEGKQSPQFDPNSAAASSTEGGRI